MMLRGLIILCLSACSAARAEAGEAPGRKVPTCIDRFCLGKHRLLEKSVTDVLGAGHLMDDVAKSRCYEIPRARCFMHVQTGHDMERKELMGVFVSDVPNCPRAEPVKATIACATREGLRLGDTREAVIRIYGTPKFDTKADGMERLGLDYEAKRTATPFGDQLLEYRASDADGPSAAIYLRDGRVAAISISIGE